MAPTRKPKQEPVRRSSRVQLASTNKKAMAEKEANTTAITALAVLAPIAPKAIAKPKRFRRPRQKKSCRLLSLPGELRNSIYRYALVNANGVCITSSGPGEPALLRICTALRKESRAIYYSENNFRLHVHSYKGAWCAKFDAQYRPFQPAFPGKARFGFLMGGEPNWENLLEWVKAAFLSLPVRPDYDVPETRDDHIVGAAFRMADELRGRVSWKGVEAVLKAYHDGLKGMCSIWANADGH
ncbi:hypothetical protein LTR08_001486 [Meristemomyces frigidus]|nr:hypothetical protein LTR08_001486 [Meristemomyces frigidus]